MELLTLARKRSTALLLVRFGEGKIIKDDLSESEFDFVSQLGQSHGDIFSSQTLVELLTAYEKTTGAYIPSLPLELALINIIQGK